MFSYTYSASLYTLVRNLYLYILSIGSINHIFYLAIYCGRAPPSLYISLYLCRDIPFNISPLV
jgi:hypothetical protein